MHHSSMHISMISVILKLERLPNMCVYWALIAIIWECMSEEAGICAWLCILPTIRTVFVA